MLADVAAILALDDVPYQFNDGHLQQDPPPFPPYLFRDVLLNDLVVEITRFILGEGVKNSSYSGNTCLPNKTQQPLHVEVEGKSLRNSNSEVQRLRLAVLQVGSL